ncbi:hypothetical protein DK26_12730 [Bosea sp. WAO]|nr:hypothetical protein DK26_12730 [Bosea sp. WAO]
MLCVGDALSQFRALHRDRETAAPDDQIEEGEHQQGRQADDDPGLSPAGSQLSIKVARVFIYLADRDDGLRPCLVERRVYFDQSLAETLLVGTFRADHVLEFGDDLAARRLGDIRRDEVLPDDALRHVGVDDCRVRSPYLHRDDPLRDGLAPEQPIQTLLRFDGHGAVGQKVLHLRLEKADHQVGSALTRRRQHAAGDPVRDPCPQHSHRNAKNNGRSGKKLRR